jgi:signal transduction histidine kinase
LSKQQKSKRKIEINSRESISWISFGLSGITLLLANVPLIDGRSITGSSFESLSEMLISVAASHFAFFGFLVLARQSILRVSFARVSRRWLFWLIITSVFFGNIAATIILQAVWGFQNTSLTSLSFLVFQVFVMLVVGKLSRETLEYRRSISNLEAQRKLLLENQYLSKATLESEKNNTVSYITEKVLSAIAKLSPADPKASQAAMAELSNWVIRPYSHDLFNDFPTFEGSKEASSRKLDWKTSLRGILETPLISPLALSSALTYMGFQFTITGLPPTDERETLLQLGAVGVSVSLTPLIEAVSVLLAIFALTFIASRATVALHAASRKRASDLSNWGLLILQLIVIAVFTLVLIHLAFFLPWFPEVAINPPLVLIGIFLVFLTVTAAIAAIRTAASIRSASALELHTLNESLIREIALTNEKLWQERQQLARAIHGPLQSAVNAASIQLGTVTEVEKNLPELVRSISATILDALAKVGGQSLTASSWRSELDEVQHMWANVAELHLSIDPESASILDINPVTASTVIQIISEASANSAIHGLATEIKVAVSTRENVMTITVSDDGRGLEHRSEGGLGSKFLDDVSLEWSLQRKEDTVLTVTIPC